MAEEAAEPSHPLLPSGLELRYDPAWVKAWQKDVKSTKLLELPQHSGAGPSRRIGVKSGGSSPSNKSGDFADVVCFDLVYQTLIFSRSTCLTNAQSAAFASIVEDLLRTLQHTACSFEESFQQFSTAIKKQTSVPAKASGSTSPAAAQKLTGSQEGSVQEADPDADAAEPEPLYHEFKAAAYNFSPSEAKLMVDFISETFFKHFSLYRCCVVRGLLQLPLINTFRVNAHLEQPSPIFLQASLKDADNLSEKKRKVEAEAKAVADAEEAERKKKEEEEAERDRLDRERIIAEQGGYNDPEMQKLIVPMEMREALEKHVTDTENRVRDKLNQIDPDALRNAQMKFLND